MTEKLDRLLDKVKTAKILHKTYSESRDYAIVIGGFKGKEHAEKTLEKLESLIEDGEKWKSLDDPNSIYYQNLIEKIQITTFNMLIEKKDLESQLTKLSEKYENCIKEHAELHEKYTMMSVQNLDLERENKELGEIVMKLDRVLRERAINYKRDGHHEVYENTMSLYRIIFGREL